MNGEKHGTKLTNERFKPKVECEKNGMQTNFLHSLKRNTTNKAKRKGRYKQAKPRTEAVGTHDGEVVLQGDGAAEEAARRGGRQVRVQRPVAWVLLLVDVGCSGGTDMRKEEEEQRKEKKTRS